MLSLKGAGRKETMSIIGYPVTDVDTPALLVDLDRLDANIRCYAEAAARVGTHLRPHIKTHKTLQIWHQ